MSGVKMRARSKIAKLKAAPNGRRREASPGLSESLRHATRQALARGPWGETVTTGFAVLVGSTAVHGPFRTAAAALSYARRHFRFLGWSLVETRCFTALETAIRAQGKLRSAQNSGAGKGRR